MYRQKQDDFLLLYPDGTKTDKLPDNSVEFTLQGYRNFLDPQYRYDRIKLYLCEKKNYDINSIEIMTDESSSSDDLPHLTSPSTKAAIDTIVSSANASASFADNDAECASDDNTLPLVIEVDFHHGEKTFRKSFANNTKASELFSYVHAEIQQSASLKRKDYYLNPDDRLLELTSTSKLTIDVEVIHGSEDMENTENDVHINGEIDASFQMSYNNKHGEIISSIINKTLNELGDTSEPVQVLHAYRKYFLQGRPLDVIREDQTVEGDTSVLFVSRYNIYSDALTEFPYIQNIRNPVEVSYYGERAQDYGGPRREFFTKLVKEIEDDLFMSDNHNDIVIKQHLQSLAYHKYFYGGLILALSALEGGPLSKSIDSVLKNSPVSEAKNQFEQGLERVGLITLMSKKPGLKFLFMPNDQREITINRLIHLLAPEFSEPGSNSRIKEEFTYRLFLQYAREVHAGRRRNVQLSDILKFVTGSEEEPIMGFSIQPGLAFSGDIIFPMASTCICRLTLPLVEEEINKDILFEKFDLGFLNDFFGLD